MWRRRYFTNNMPDYNPRAEVPIDKNLWHQRIIALINTIKDNAHTVRYDGGLYTGTAGIAYMLYYASLYEPLSAYRHEYLRVAADLFDRDIRVLKKHPVTKDNQVSLMLGPSGLYAVGILLGHALQNESMLNENIQRYQSLYVEVMKHKFLPRGCDELFVGRAGYLCGALAIEKQLGIKVLEDSKKTNICQAMFYSGKRYAKKHKLQIPLMYAYHRSEYLGAAHGISSILLMMMSCPHFLATDERTAELVKATFYTVIRMQQNNSNFPPVRDDGSQTNTDELVHWCHGVPGILYMMVKGINLWGPGQHNEVLLRCSNAGKFIWSTGLLKKGPGLCHGIAGNGYAFLLLYRLTQDKKYLHRAHQFANFIYSKEFQDGARTPDSFYSLFEGISGTVCFLIDLMQPEKAAFPFYDVF